MVALRKDPGVATRNRAQLDDGPPAEALARDVRVADVAFKRDPVLVRRQADSARRDSVGAVGADHDVGLEPLALDHDRSRRVGHRHLRPVAELGTRAGRPTGEEGVEPAPLGHQHERLFGASAPASPVAKPELERVDAVFDHRLDRERELPHRAQRQATAAWLVARKPSAVD